MLALKSLIGKINPLGAPFSEALCEKEYCVFAIQIGRPENPCLLYISICFSAYLHRKKERKKERKKDRRISLEVHFNQQKRRKKSHCQPLSASQYLCPT